MNPNLVGWQKVQGQMITCASFSSMISGYSRLI